MIGATYNTTGIFPPPPASPLALWVPSVPPGYFLCPRSVHAIGCNAARTTHEWMNITSILQLDDSLVFTACKISRKSIRNDARRKKVVDAS